MVMIDVVTFFIATHLEKNTMVVVVIFFFSNRRKRRTRQWHLSLLFPSSHQHHQKKEQGNDNYNCCHFLCSNTTRGLGWPLCFSYKAERRRQWQLPSPSLQHYTHKRKQQQIVVFFFFSNKERKERKGNNNYHHLFAPTHPHKKMTTNCHYLLIFK